MASLTYDERHTDDYTPLRIPAPYSIDINKLQEKLVVQCITEAALF